MGYGLMMDNINIKKENMKTIKLTEKQIKEMVKRTLKEQDESNSNLSDGADVYNDIYDILEPVLESLYKKHGENMTIDLDDTILMVIQDWLESDDYDYDDDDIDDDGDGPTTPWEAIKYGLTPKIKINDKKIN
jgi:hypothetical protein